MGRFVVNALELRHVTKRFGEQVIANRDVSMTVRQGELLAVLGENGGVPTLTIEGSGVVYTRAE